MNRQLTFNERSYSKYEVRAHRVGEYRALYEAKVNSAEKAARFIFQALEPDTYAEERFQALMLNNAGDVIGFQEISRGELSGTVVHPREVFKLAVILNAAAMIITHNHPSGRVTPSDEDITTTKRLEEAGEILGINVLDHIITGYNNQYYSLKAEGAGTC